MAKSECLFQAARKGQLRLQTWPKSWFRQAGGAALRGNMDPVGTGGSVTAEEVPRWSTGIFPFFSASDELSRTTV